MLWQTGKCHSFYGWVVLCVCVCVSICFIHSSVDGHSGCFHSFFSPPFSLSLYFCFSPFCLSVSLSLCLSLSLSHTHTHTSPWVSIWFEGISGPSEDDQLECRKKILEFIFNLKLKKKKKLIMGNSMVVLWCPLRGQTELKPQSQKTNQHDQMGHSLCNSMKLWAMPHRATQNG